MKKPADYIEAPQAEITFDDLVETAMRPYSLGELRTMRDELSELLRKAAPTSAEQLNALIRCAPRQEAGAYTALMATTSGRPALRKRLGVLRTLCRYIHARELAASPGSRDLPPPRVLRHRSRSSRHCSRNSSTLNLNPKNPHHERTNLH